MKLTEFSNDEGSFGDKAHAAERDNEIQLARAELFRAAKSAIDLHNLLKTFADDQVLHQGVHAKITKAADYLDQVKHEMDKLGTDMAANNDLSLAMNQSGGPDSAVELDADPALPLAPGAPAAPTAPAPAAAPAAPMTEAKKVLKKKVAAKPDDKKKGPSCDNCGQSCSEAEKENNNGMCNECGYEAYGEGPANEDASAGATSSGAIATVPAASKKILRRKK